MIIKINFEPISPPSGSDGGNGTNRLWVMIGYDVDNPANAHSVKAPVAVGWRDADQCLDSYSRWLGSDDNHITLEASDVIVSYDLTGIAIPLLIIEHASAAPHYGAPPTNPNLN